MSRLLKQRFQQNYGLSWRQFYVLPAVRQAMLQELRDDLARDLDQALFQEDPPEARPDARRGCKCYIHRFFGDNGKILFSVCSRRGQ